MIYSSLSGLSEDRAKLNQEFRDSIEKDSSLSMGNLWGVKDSEDGDGMLSPTLHKIDWDLRVNKRFGNLTLVNKGEIIFYADKNDFKEFKKFFDDFLKVNSLYSIYVKKWNKLG